ncbi:zinc finger protein Pegasus-like [Homarus americanus]|nr:zinc finger protein Pegasus-like [Homarus americanus]
MPTVTLKHIVVHATQKPAGIRKVAGWAGGGGEDVMIPGPLSLLCYRCPHCPFVAGNRKRLRAHMSAHSDRRPHSCSYCDYRATCNKDLQKHIRTHTGEKPYQCELCPYRASDPSNYRAHMKFRHKNLILPVVPPHGKH